MISASDLSKTVGKIKNKKKKTTNIRCIALKFQQVEHLLLNNDVLHTPIIYIYKYMMKGGEIYVK